MEAQHQHQLSRVLNRWARVELIVIDELAYVAVADLGAELLFQLIAERAEKATVIATTNLPFSEWTTVFPSARLCKALLDRLTDRAHIIDTGTESYRFRRSLERRQSMSRPKPRARAGAGEAVGTAPVADHGIAQNREILAWQRTDQERECSPFQSTEP